MTSSRADLSDARVRGLDDEIVAAQKREIVEMNWLISDIAENGKATTQADAEDRPIPEFAPEDCDG